MSDLFAVLAAVGGLLLVLGTLAGLVHEKGVLSEPLFALLAGVLIGPSVLGLFDLADFGDPQTILEGAALLTLAVALVGVALRLPVGYVQENWRLLAVLLGVLMPLMWLGCSLLAYLILGLSPPASLLVGAIVTPTDPVVASTIVTGDVAERNLPGRLRHAIAAESGFNDALALPFVALPLLWLTEAPGEALSHWLAYTLLLEVVAGAALAAVIGYVTGKTLRWAEARETLERTSLLTVGLALSLTVLGVAEVLGLNGVLAAFVAGAVFNVAGSSDRKEQQEDAQEAITRFFDLPIFVLLGMALPWGLARARLEWRLSGRGGAAAQAAPGRDGPAAPAREARGDARRPLSGVVRARGGRGALLRRLRAPGDGPRAGMDRRQPHRVRLRARPWRNRHAPHQALWQSRPELLARRLERSADRSHLFANAVSHQLSATRRLRWPERAGARRGGWSLRRFPASGFPRGLAGFGNKRPHREADTGRRRGTAAGGIGSRRP